VRRSKDNLLDCALSSYTVLVAPVRTLLRLCGAAALPSLTSGRKSGGQTAASTVLTSRDPMPRAAAKLPVPRPCRSMPARASVADVSDPLHGRAGRRGSTHRPPRTTRGPHFRLRPLFYEDQMPATVLPTLVPSLFVRAPSPARWSGLGGHACGVGDPRLAAVWLGSGSVSAAARAVMGVAAIVEATARHGGGRLKRQPWPPREARRAYR
jgi:hypothetical protein